MKAPPKTVVVELTEKEVRKNFLKILNSMNSIREESIVNLGATDEQKTDYLRLTGELSGCLKELIEENNLEEHVSAVTNLVEREPLLKHYDPLQGTFWDGQKSEMGKSLVDLGAALLKEEFYGENQAYHLFQAMKLLNSKNEEREETYETILPVNNLLKKQTLKDPKITSYLLEKIFSAKIEETGEVSVENETTNELDGLLEVVGDLGALCVDLPKKNYEKLRQLFPKTTLSKKEGKEITRVVFENEIPTQHDDINTKLHEIAKLDLGKAEEDLVKKIDNFYSYGKEFQKAVQEKTGTKRKEQKKDKKEAQFEKEILLERVDYSKSYSEWQQYWSEISNRVMASVGDIYKSIKQLKNNTKISKENEREILKTFRYDMDWNNGRLLLCNTKIDYNQNNIATMINSDNKKEQYHFSEAVRLKLVQEGNVQRTATEPILRSLFETKDDIETIIKTLEYLSGKNRKKIEVDLSYADKNPKPIIMYSQSGNFYVVIPSEADIHGISRGVILK